MKKIILSTIFVTLSAIFNVQTMEVFSSKEEKNFFTTLFNEKLAENQKIVELKKLINKNKKLVNTTLRIPNTITLENNKKIQTISTITPLTMAISGELIDIAHLFIDSGADVNEPTTVQIKDTQKILEKEYPLMLSIMMTEVVDENSFNITKKLINKKANLNITNIEGVSPLMLAAALPQKKTVELLLTNNADVTLTLKTDYTALDENEKPITFKAGSTALDIAELAKTRANEEEKKEYQAIITLLQNAQKKSPPTNNDTLLQSLSHLEKSLSYIQKIMD